MTPVANTSPTTGVAVLSAASDQVSEIDYINQILSTGQSLSVGVNASPALTTTQPYNNLMLSGGYGGLGTGTSFTPLIESSVETMSSAMANTITANDPGNDFDVLVSLHGVSGYTYSQLKKGTSPYNAGMTQVTNAKSAATALGRVSRVIGVTTIHGETDNYNGVSGATYQGYLEEWQHDYETDVKAITGQSGTIPLFLDQMSSFMSSYANDATSEIPIYQLKAAEDNPGKIYLVGPKYYYNYSDRHHLTAASSRWDGEYYGKVIKKVVIDHEAWRPLTPDSAVRSGRVIYVDFHVPAGHLAFDTTLVSARTNYGFEYYDSTNSASISSVQILDDNTVKITLSGVPTGSNQRIRYAYTGVPGTDTGAQNAGSAAGNLRDTDPYPSLYGNTLYNWAVHFDQAITTDGTAPTISAVSASGATNSATVTWETSEPASSQVVYGLTSGYSLSTSESDTDSLVSSHSVALSNLLPCATYHYAAVSKDAAQNQATSTDETFMTLGCAGSGTAATSTSSAITTTSGGNVSLTGTDGSNVAIVIPPGFTATSSTVIFQASQIDETASFFAEVGRPTGLNSIGSVYMLQAFSDATTTLTTFAQPLSITLSYDPDSLGSLDVSTLVIYSYDATTGWTRLTDCSVNSSAHTVTCETSHFSDFSIFGQTVSASPAPASTSRSGVFGYRPKQLVAQVTPASVPTTIPIATVFTKDLELGIVDHEIKLLQQYLNTHGFQLAQFGPGSPGQETEKFGPLTKLALSRFQMVNKISPAVGYFGPITRAYVAAHP